MENYVQGGRCFCDCVQYFKEENGQKCTNCGRVPFNDTMMHEAERSSSLYAFGHIRSYGGSVEEITEDDSGVPFRYQLSESILGSNTDILGNLRGRCKRCNCRQYSYIKERGPKCSECGHVPTQHTQLTQQPKAPRKFIGQEHEFEKDTPLFTKSQNASSSLCITDVEDDNKTPPPPPAEWQAQSLIPVNLIGKHHPSGMSLPVAGQMGPFPHMSPVIRPRDGHISQQHQSFISMSPIAPAAANAIPQLSFQQPSIQQMCKLAGCNKRVYVEPSGKVHEFCCRQHALDFNSNGVPPHLKCSNPSCGRMKYKENVDYCGNSCRNAYRRSLQQGLQAATASLPVGSQMLPGNICLLPGCNKPKHYDLANSRHWDYCGQGHAKEAKKNLIRKASRQEFQRIQTHFTQWWDSRKGTCGQLYEVFVIDNPKLKDQFQKYRLTLSVKTVNQYYHGTSLKCPIYQSNTVCNDRTCGICGVSQNGMQQKFKTSNIKFQRFGDGFYLAPNSSKCHDYTQGHDKYRAMLLFNVAEGNKYIVQNDQTTLKAAPQGFDSVYGQRGGSLNYDEIVLYKSEALLPTHFVVYIKDGVHKIAN